LHKDGYKKSVKIRVIRGLKIRVIRGFRLQSWDDFLLFVFIHDKGAAKSKIADSDSTGQ
jgi:hypothetical protein